MARSDDAGHRETDQILAALEKRIKEEYSAATKEAEKKLNKFLKDSAAKDKEMRQSLAAGEISQQEYNNWKTGQVMTGKRWNAMRDTLAQDLANSDKIARQMMYGTQPDIYATNYNYAGYQIERDSNINTSFVMYDRATVEALMKEDKDLLPQPSEKRQREIDAANVRWDRKKVTSAVTQSILLGDSIPDMAKRVAAATNETNMKAAIRNARTMATGAENRGRQDAYSRAEDMGIEIKKEWVATLDGHTRDSHRIADGMVVKMNETFSLMHGELEYPGDPAGPPAETYNCFVGDTLVAADCQIEKSYCHQYVGKLLTIKTASGVQFTCTPNHPVLTPRGWIRADLFHEGDDILVTGRSDDIPARVNPDVNHVFTRVDAIHKFFDKSGRKRGRALCVNFNGYRPTTEVEIVTLKRLLWRDRDTSKAKDKRELGFEFTDKPFVSQGSFVKHFRGVCLSAFRFMRSIGKAFSFRWWGIRHPDIHTFRPAANGDIVLPEYAINNLPAETMVRSELLDGLTGKVFVDHVVDVKICAGNCHVYNLQTESGYYFVSNIVDQRNGKCNDNSVIVKNCRCTMIPVVGKIDPRLSGDRISKLGSMSYEEWKEGHDPGDNKASYIR